MRNVLVRKVEGPTEAPAGATIVFRATAFNLSDATPEEKKQINWVIVEAGNLVSRFRQHGETLEYSVPMALAGKTIQVMPYLNRPTPKVSVSTQIVEIEPADSPTPVDSGSEVVRAGAIPYRWIGNELAFDREYRNGDKGKKVKIIQEWLSLHGPGIAMDSDFGQITEGAVRRFQEINEINPTGVVDEQTFNALVEPMLRALTPVAVAGKNYNDLIIEHAHQHLVEHPVEVGGQNEGPWVRLYMRGHQGRDWPWCAGFVCFILQQAADTMGISTPFRRTFSCDVLAERARNRDIFVSERDLSRENPPRADMPAGSVFLVRRTPGDWTHTGIVTQFGAEGFETIEGNTNDEGSREGYEVCNRLRGYRRKDFIRI